MAENKSISVWLVLKDGKNKGKIALQKRSEEKFQCVCQATFAGKVEPKESINDAIKRECKEELGGTFCEQFNFGSLKLHSKEVYEMEGQDWQANNFLGFVEEKLLLLAKIHNKAYSEFIFTGKDDKIFTQSSKKDPKENVVLFDDQYKALKQILNGN
jgi:hypothetical protein